MRRPEPAATIVCEWRTAVGAVAVSPILAGRDAPFRDSAARSKSTRTYLVLTRRKPKELLRSPGA